MLCNMVSAQHAAAVVVASFTLIMTLQSHRYHCCVPCNMRAGLGIKPHRYIHVQYST